ncbi:MAG: hypothetical protein AAF127_09330 [Pseudomonadota bacterium]
MRARRKQITMSPQLSVASLFSILATAGLCVSAAMSSGMIAPLTSGGLILSF